MLLFIAAFLVTGVVVWALTRPLLRPLTAPEAASAFNAAVFRDQLKELEREVARGAIAESEAAVARTEIERRLLAAATRAEAPAKVGAASRSAAMLVGAAVAIAAGGIYLTIGRPGAPDRPLSARVDTEKSIPGGDAMHGEMNDLVRQLAEKLEENPGDPQGWALMARSLMRLDRASEALGAYERAIRLSNGGDGALRAEYAEARIVAAQGAVDDTAREIYRAMLREDPQNAQARYYLATAKAQDGDTAGALADWRALLADTPAGAPWREMLEQRIAEASGAQAPARGPARADVEAAAQLSEGERAAMIEGMVARLAARLEQNPQDLAGWRQLARAYGVQGKSDDAARAHERVLALAPNDPDALWALGEYAKARGDKAGARRRWQKLERVLPPNAPERAQVRAALAGL